MTALAPKSLQAARQAKDETERNGAGQFAKALGYGDLPIRKGDPGWRPEGPQQYDRVRALAETIRRRYSAHGGMVAAVGIVGSDTYDKLVLLQALRPMLPEAIFFTTDLDANLLSV